MTNSIQSSVQVMNIKDTMQEIMSLSADSSMPMGLKKILRETFKCLLLHTVSMNPPGIVTKCCKSILGCEARINSWYSGDDVLMKAYPFCRAERG